MKKFSNALVLILVVATTVMGQEFWYWQNPIPQGNKLNDVWMFNSQVILAVGDVGTIIKTTDAGINWSVTHYNGGITSDLYSVFFIDLNTGWAAGEHGKILKTINGGISWSVLMTDDSLTINGLFFHDSQNGWAIGNKIHLGIQKGVILKSTDGGASWIIEEQANTTSLDDICFFNDKTGWTIGSQYQNPEDIILRTEDGGATWMPYYSGHATGLYSVCFVDSLHGWAVGKGITSSSTIIYSNDSGKNWTVQNQPGSDKILWVIAFRDQNVGWAAGAAGTMLQTLDGGISWDSVASQVSRNLKAIAFADPQVVLAVGNAGIITRSGDNGSVWQEISTGTTRWNYHAVFFTDPDTGWVVGPDKTILKSLDGGETWTPQVSKGTERLWDIYFINNKVGWSVGEPVSVSEDGVILHTTDGGENWIEQPSGSKNFLYSCYFIDEQKGWVCGGPNAADSSVVLHTSDGGNQWMTQSCPASASLRDIYFINELEGWAVGDNSNVVHTTDAGGIWSLITTPGSENYTSVFFITPKIGWIGGKSILKTTDGGSTWTPQLSLSDEQQIHDIDFIDFQIGWAAVLGSPGGLYKTMDGGANWTNLEIGTKNALYDISIINDETGWVVGTFSTILKTDAIFVPVELTSFNGVWIDDRVELSWITASELNNFGFEVQRKFSDKWNKIGFVKGHGTTTRLNYYSFPDYPKGGGKYSYRLKQLDIDGKVKYSPTREVNVPTKFSLYQNSPNPFNPETAIGFELPVNAYVKLEIYNMLGQKIATLIDEHRPAGFQQVTWDGKDNTGKPVGSGVYFYHIKSGRFEATKKLVLLR
jgi:photosystem II stability/assembly factor-like uncharacterized protein